ncbi:AAA+ ATPase [Gracilaria domingensis]|nr:AAA+ ATPase [Gracilaria domingensis]
MHPVDKEVVPDDDAHRKLSSDEHHGSYSDKEARTVIQQQTANSPQLSPSEDNLDDAAEEEDNDDDDDPNFDSPKRSLPLRLPISSRAAAFVTKSGRVSKPPQSVAPEIGAKRRRDKSIPERRYSGRLRSGTRRLGIFPADGKEIHDAYGIKPEPDLVARSKRSGGRLVSTEEYETRRRTRTSSHPNAVANDHARSNPYQTRNRSRREANGRTRSSRQGRNMLDSDDEEDDRDDCDFQTPQSPEEESDDEPAAYMEETELDRSRHDATDEEIAASSAPGRLRRTRKRQPQRSLRKRKRVRTRPDRDQNALARETRKSYRPRRESLRPVDFYMDRDRSSDENDSSDYSAPLPKRPRSTRAAASRAGDAIANDVSKLDFLQNPMALADVREPVRPKRLDRFGHKRNRMAPTRPDPFASDADDALGGGPSAIEPVQVDLDLSWDDIGGLDHHVRALKEMVFLPLLYPEVFEKFHMEPPKGVLFYGPPGTGKTLCARALAASCGADPVQPEQPVVSDSKAPKPQVESEQKNDNAKTASPVRQNGRLVEDEIIDGSGFDEVTHKSEAPVIQKPTALPSDMAEKEKETKPQSNADHDVVMKDLNSTQKEAHSPTGDSAKPALPKKVKKKPRVAFFMRNGADCLSKWVGEAERHLRMTFEAAKRHQPSIIFFDEIDGLAPVRSSRQDQIHSSIVSTLLSLMDGLDARGKVVVIGATNRVDAIDPALRRPGRFDRELIFTLPNIEARRRILGIHTTKWKPPPNPKVLDAVASIAVGYCGADLKALCSEAAIRALRRRYPQIYSSQDKLVINVNEVRVSTKDFVAAMKDIIPASHRSARTYARPISERLRPILSYPLVSCIYRLQRIFAPGLNSHGSLGQRTIENGKSSSHDDEDGSSQH